MERRDRIDPAGAAMLIGFAVLFGLNQVAIKVVGGGIQPVFAAALRSAGAVLCVAAWMRLRGLSLRPEPGTVPAGLLIGALFAVEFLALFIALDLTGVVRASVLFYSMPVWLAIAAHYVLPGERMHRAKAAGLALASAGVVVALADRGGAGEGSLAGDLLAVVAAMGWAGLALVARASALARVRPEKQLLWQVVVSTPLLLALAPAFGPLLRDPTPLHWASLGFQTVVVVSGGFILWLWLLARYPASGVASFSFLTPVVGVALGWALLGEPVGPGVIVSAALVAAGIVLVNRPVGGGGGLARVD